MTEFEKYCDDVYRDAILAGKTTRGAELAVQDAKIKAVEVEVLPFDTDSSWMIPSAAIFSAVFADLL